MILLNEFYFVEFLQKIILKMKLLLEIQILGKVCMSLTQTIGSLTIASLMCIYLNTFFIDSYKVMGIKGRRVHMIEELSGTIVSFQRGEHL